MTELRSLKQNVNRRLKFLRRDLVPVMNLIAFQAGIRLEEKANMFDITINSISL